MSLQTISNYKLSSHSFSFNIATITIKNSNQKLAYIDYSIVIFSGSPIFKISFTLININYSLEYWNPRLTTLKHLVLAIIELAFYISSAPLTRNSRL